MIRPPLEIRLRKEFRAILPAFAAAVVSVLAMGMDESRQIGVSLLRGFAAAGFFISIVSIGALSVGHEYGHRTLIGLLAQPIDRRRLILTKIVVSAAAVLALAAVTWATVDATELAGGLGMTRSAARSDADDLKLVLLVLPALCALCLAPWLTMVCRNPMAGIVFTLAVPGVLWLAGEVASVTKYGITPRIPDAASDLRFGIFFWGMAAAVVIGPLAGWQTFMRLQAIEGGHAALHLPGWLETWRRAPAARPAARRSAMWLVLRKELHFQHLTLAVSAFFVLGWLLVSLIRKLDPDFQLPVIYAMTMLHMVAIPLLTGSLGSAEERQLGTAEWQTLLPVAPWRTWSIKAGVVIGLALGLGLGLPGLLNIVWPSDDLQLLRNWRTPLLEYVLRTSATIVSVAVLSLYVSSLSRGGMRALLMAMPAAMAAFLGLGLLRMLDASIFGNHTASSLLSSLGWRGWQSAGGSDFPVLPLTVALIAVMAGVVIALGRYAMFNHRSAERGAMRVVRQLATLGVCLAVGLTAWSGVFAYYREPRVEQIEEQRRIFREQYYRWLEERRNQPR